MWTGNKRQFITALLLQYPALAWANAFDGISGVNIDGINNSGFGGSLVGVSQAWAWWGLRAYSRDAIGSKAVRLRRDSDQAEQDFVTLSSGALDVASITTFKGTANLFVTKLYDQTGNGYDQVQTTVATQPGFSLNVIGSLPGITFSGTQRLVGAATFLRLPYTLAAVYKRTGGSGYQGLIGGNGGALFFGPQAPTTVEFWCSPHITDGVSSNNVFHSLIGVANATAGTLSVDATTTTGAPATISMVNFVLGSDDSAGVVDYFTGNILEAGVWPFSFNAAQISSMNTNQHAYWGF